MCQGKTALNDSDILLNKQGLWRHGRSQDSSERPADTSIGFPKRDLRGFSADFQFTVWLFKGCADQYVRDYSKNLTFKNIVSGNHALRDSPVRVEKGWISTSQYGLCLQSPIKIYGDGKQVRMFICKRPY